jgi:hypothetical protein
MHDPQAAPERQFVAVGHRHVDGRGPSHAQHCAAGALHPAAPDARAGIRVGAVDMLLLERMCVDRRAGEISGPDKIAGMVEMAMGEQDRLDGTRLQPEPGEAPADQPRLTDEPGVEQHGVALRLHQKVADAHHAADGVDAGISHRPTGWCAFGAKLWLSERLEGDDGVGILDARDNLHLLVHEMADVDLVFDIELAQQVVVAGGGIDFGSDLGVRDRVCDIVGFAELAFDLDEEGYHLGSPGTARWRAMQQNHGPLASVDHDVTISASKASTPCG